VTGERFTRRGAEWIALGQNRAGTIAGAAGGGKPRRRPARAPRAGPEGACPRAAYLAAGIYFAHVEYQGIVRGNRLLRLP